MTEPSHADASPEVDQPGLRELRQAVSFAQSQLPRPDTIRQDAVAGLNNAVSGVPDGMASGILAGVNPVYGLYGAMVGPIVGALFSSSRLMVVTTTGASAIAAGQAVIDVPAEERAESLFLIVLLIGAFQVLFGVLKLGKLTRFVSYAVMRGFMTGIAVLSMLTQLPAATGYEPEGSNRVSQTINLFGHVQDFHWWSVAIAAGAVGLAVLLPRTKIGNFGMLVAIVIPSLLVVIFGLGSVQIVDDVGDIPRGVPSPALPDFGNLTPQFVLAAAAVAAVIAVQGAGVSQSVPNPDGSRQSMSRDFIGEGAANIASGLLRGVPVGGSLGATALSVVSGARSRWAAIFAGLWVGIIVIALPGVIAKVAMPSLAALLIVASAATLKRREILSIWNTGWPARVASIGTFVTLLFFPIQIAVGTGIVLSALLYVLKSAADITVVELVRREDGLIEEREPAVALPSNKVTVVDVYGKLFFAAARRLEKLLPDPRGAERPVLVLRLRGHSSFGATLVEVLSKYAAKIEEAGGRLYLSGVSEQVHRNAARTGKLPLAGTIRVYEATPVVGQSTRAAFRDAEEWLSGQDTGREVAGPSPRT
ncbi:MAG: SulP family inorganic anion transporter [Dehalococcoidia bacterium]